MLVLTRRANQSIMIGSDVVITVLEVHGEQVRIGIKAPRSITVHREELYYAIQQANKAAASPTPAALEGLGAIRPLVPKSPPPSPDNSPS
ncbi:MAG: carbon storage regulator CsrA [Acidimicrobiales bacterium]